MTSDNLIVLKDGLALPVEALRLAWALEDRGYVFRVDGDDLFVNPCSGLTAHDWDQLRHWKLDLRTIVTYSNQVM